jgi:hypothetical protein
MLKIMTFVLVVVGTIAPALAGQPPRPNDSIRTVTVTLPEYNRLLALAALPPDSGAQPTVAAVLANAELQISVDGDTARGTFNLTGNALRPGISRVALISGATLLDASASGNPIPLIVEGNAHHALVPGPGPFALSLGWGAPLRFTPGRAAFALPVPQAGAVRAVFDVPGEQADVHLSAGLVTRRSSSAGRTTIEATLEPGSATEVWWSMRDSAPVAAARDVRVLADVLSLITLGDADVQMVALVDLTVVQGEPRTLRICIPDGYVLMSISGATLLSSEPSEGGALLTLSDPSAPRHQFLVTLERPHQGRSFELSTGFVTVPGAGRERGEIAVEGAGTLELTAADREGLQRIDVRELDQALHSLARLPILSAFRYQTRTEGAPALALEVRRFDDAGVLAAFADYAIATTLVTIEGRALTELQLRVQNRAQPFLKVTLPPGATIVSVDVAGQPAKPVIGSDGVRVPLLRPGFRPNGAYDVSFVYLHPGVPLARKGDLQTLLPKMDIPVGLVRWEVFTPDNYSMRAIGGNAVAQPVVDRAMRALARDTNYESVVTTDGPTPEFRLSFPIAVKVAATGRLGDVRVQVEDHTGGDLPGVSVRLDVGGRRFTAVTRENGAALFSGVPEGSVALTVELIGFKTERYSFMLGREPMQVDVVLSISSVAESVTVTGAAPAEDTASARQPNAPSQNVINVQRKVAGVLPVRIDVPRAGFSHEFVKPLVVDQETVVSFRYKRK